MTQASWVQLTFELVLACALALTILAGVMSAWRSLHGARSRRRLAVVELAWVTFPLVFLIALAAVAIIGGHA